MTTTDRRSARGQSLPDEEIALLAELKPASLHLRAKMLYEAGWTLRAIGEAFDPPRARSTIRYWITAPTPIVGFDPVFPDAPVPTLRTGTAAGLPPRRTLTITEKTKIADLAPTARKYRATMNKTHPAARANKALTEMCVRLHHTDRVTIRDLADAAGVSYRAMARRVS